MGKRGGNRKKSKGNQPKKSNPSTPSKAKVTAPVVADAGPEVVLQSPVDPNATPLSTGPAVVGTEALEEAPLPVADTNKLVKEPVPVINSQPQGTIEKSVADTLPEHVAKPFADDNIANLVPLTVEAKDDRVAADAVKSNEAKRASTISESEEKAATDTKDASRIAAETGTGAGATAPVLSAAGASKAPGISPATTGADENASVATLRSQSGVVSTIGSTERTPLQKTQKTPHQVNDVTPLATQERLQAKPATSTTTNAAPRKTPTDLGVGPAGDGPKITNGVGSAAPSSTPAQPARAKDSVPATSTAAPVTATQPNVGKVQPATAGNAAYPSTNGQPAAPIAQASINGNATASTPGTKETPRKQSFMKRMFRRVSHIFRE